MKVFYHVQNETEMATCQYLTGLDHGGFSILHMVPETLVDEIQISVANNVLIISGVYSLKKGYAVEQIHPKFPVTGFSLVGTKIVYYVNIPKDVATDGIQMVCFEMEGI